MVCGVVVHTNTQTNLDQSCRHVMHFYTCMSCIFACHALLSTLCRAFMHLMGSCRLLYACMHATQLTDASPCRTLCRREGGKGLSVRPVAAISRGGLAAPAIILSKHASSELENAQTRVNDAAWPCAWKVKFGSPTCIAAELSPIPVRHC